MTLAEAERGRGWTLVLLGIILVGSSCCFFFLFFLHIFQGYFDGSVVRYTRVGVWVGVSAIRAVVKTSMFSSVKSGRPIGGTRGGRFVSRYFLFFFARGVGWGGGGEGGR